MSYIKATQLLLLVQDLIIQHKIRCPEAIYQVDSINEELPEMMIKICDMVGYYEDLVDAQTEIKIEDSVRCPYCMKDYCDCNLHGVDG